MPNQYPYRYNTTNGTATEDDPRYETPGGAANKIEQALEDAKEYTDAELVSYVAQTVNLADDSVTRPKIAPGAVGATELDPSLLDYTTDVAVANKFNQVDAQLADIATNLRNYGAVLDGVADDTAAFIAAVAASSRVLIPKGILRVTSSIVINKRIEIVGQSRFESIVMKDGNFPLFVINHNSEGNGMGPLLSNFTIDSTKNGDTSVGILGNDTGRAQYDSLVIQNQGSHGIEHISGNIALFRDLILVSNGGDGIKFNGESPAVPNNNACLLLNIDARSNAGWGVNMERGASNVGVGVVVQGNTTGGLRINYRNNDFKVYAEANGTDILLTNSSNTIGNYILANFGIVTDQSSGDNTVIQSSQPGGYLSKFMNFIAQKIRIHPLNGSGILGLFNITMLANRTLELQSYNSTGRALVRASNAVGGQVCDMTASGDYIGRVASARQILTVGSATPSVVGGNYFLCNDTSTNTITNFLDGVNGQVIHVGFNNGNTTIQNSASIHLKDNANYTGAQYRVIDFIYDNTSWKEIGR
ncbi:glycosyl hydrolase family 28-related protein [Paenibacillus sp. FSL R7-0333]|uniref:glycosyl hydrolase family 28-related protein n=1 Tax=Paenibacillus sp. FSL R7-0333 TaxID=1926587 RepID=UPI00096BFFB7|nr:hypothetical protein BK146_17990 [Paenibacillus sp. FSL R7-0333]